MISKRLRTRKFDLLKLLKSSAFEKHFEKFPDLALYVNKQEIFNIQESLKIKNRRKKHDLRAELEKLQKAIEEAQELGEIQELEKIKATKSLVLNKDNDYAVEANNSLLIVKKKHAYNIYELIHDSKTGKKIPLGFGQLNLFREVTDPYLAEHLSHAALAAYPLYAKKNMRKYDTEAVIQVENAWKNVVYLNTVLPGCFVNVRDIFYGGDKSTQEYPDNKLLYVVTDKHPQSLANFFQINHCLIEDIKFIFTRLFEKYRQLYLNHFTNTDCNFENIALTKTQGIYDVIFCNPNYLINHAKSELMDYGLEFPFQHNLRITLINFYHQRFSSENLTEEEVQEIIQDFLHELEIFLTSDTDEQPEVDISSHVNNLINDFARTEHLARTPENSVNLSNEADNEHFRSDEYSTQTDSMETNTGQDFSTSSRVEYADEKDDDVKDLALEQTDQKSKEKEDADISTNTDTKDSENDTNEAIINFPAFINNLTTILTEIPKATTFTQRLFCLTSPGHALTQTFITQINNQKDHLNNPNRVFQELSGHIRIYRNMLISSNGCKLHLATLEDFLKKNHISPELVSNTELVNSIVSFSQTVSQSKL